MKKSIYLLIITIFTIVCVIVGTNIHMGGHLGISRMDDDVEEYENSATLEAFDSIAVDADVMELQIVRGEEFGIQYDCTEDMIPQDKVEKEKLVIQQKKKKNELFGTHRCSVVVTIPSEISLKNIDVETDVGDVELNQITVDRLDGQSDVGDVKLENVTAKELYWENDTGNIELAACSFDELDISTDVGDIEIESDQDLEDYEFHLETNVGEVKLQGEDYGRKCITKGSAGSVTAKSDVGDVIVK